MLQIAGEVVVAGDAHIAQLALFKMLAQMGALFRAVVEQRKMRPLGHQHDAFVTEIGGLVDEGIERQMRLSPVTRITAPLQYPRKTHSKLPKPLYPRRLP